MQMQGPQLNELVELSGPYFIPQLSGFDGAVVSVYDTQSKDSWFKPSKLLNQKLMNWAKLASPIRTKHCVYGCIYMQGISEKKCF